MINIDNVQCGDKDGMLWIVGGDENSNMVLIRK